MATMGRMLFSLFIQIICVAGFLFQVSQFSQTFFRYGATSKVVLDNKDPLKEKVVPSLLLCMTYTDILDLKGLNAKYHFNFRRSKNFNVITNMQSNLTLKQIFEFTPEVNETITTCTHRKTNGLLMEKDPGPLCYGKFTVYRFYVQSFMCYAFKYIGDVDFGSRQVANSLYDPNVLYSITLSPGFAGADMVMVCVFYGTYPTSSRQYSVLVNRLSDFYSMEVRNTFYAFGYAANQVELLAAPYETMCKDLADDKMVADCSRNCLKPMEEKIDRITFTSMIMKGVNKKHVNYFDLDDKKKRKVIKSALETCQKQCVYRPCTYNYSISYFDMAMKKFGSRDLVVAVRTAKAPGLNVKFEPKLDLMEFIIYICSCIGIWFGLSVMSLNPFEPQLRRKLNQPILFIRKIIQKHEARKRSRRT